jgi:hypothetical protein
MNNPKPDAEEIVVVLIGSFNPAIFHPEWFRREEILLPKEVEDADVKIVSTQATQVLFLDMQLDVFHNRLSLSTRDASRAERLQDIVLNILHRLPHTPVTQCGINDSLQFEVGDESHWHKIGHTLVPKDLIWNDVLENPGMNSLVVRGERAGKFPGQINVTVAPMMNAHIKFGLFVSSNYHYSIPEKDKDAPGSVLAGKFIEAEWKSSLDEARLVAYRIFDQIKKDPA